MKIQQKFGAQAVALEMTSWRATLVIAAVAIAVIGGYRAFFGESQYAHLQDQNFTAGVLPTCDSRMAANRLKRVLDALGPAEFAVTSGTQVSTGVDNEHREMRFCTADVAASGRLSQASFGLAWAAADKSGITIVIGHGAPL